MICVLGSYFVSNWIGMLLSKCRAKSMSTAQTCSSNDPICSCVDRLSETNTVRFWRFDFGTDARSLILKPVKQFLPFDSPAAPVSGFVWHLLTMVMAQHEKSLAPGITVMSTSKRPRDVCVCLWSVCVQTHEGGDQQISDSTKWQLFACIRMQSVWSYFFSILENRAIRNHEYDGLGPNIWVLVVFFSIAERWRPSRIRRSSFERSDFASQCNDFEVCWTGSTFVSSFRVVWIVQTTSAHLVRFRGCLSASQCLHWRSDLSTFALHFVGILSSRLESAVPFWYTVSGSLSVFEENKKKTCVETVSSSGQVRNMNTYAAKRWGKLQKIPSKSERKRNTCRQIVASFQKCFLVSGIFSASAQPLVLHEVVCLKSGQKCRKVGQGGVEKNNIQVKRWQAACCFPWLALLAGARLLIAIGGVDSSFWAQCNAPNRKLRSMPTARNTRRSVTTKKDIVMSGDSQKPNDIQIFNCKWPQKTFKCHLMRVSPAITFSNVGQPQQIFDCHADN